MRSGCNTVAVFVRFFAHTSTYLLERVTRPPPRRVCNNRVWFSGPCCTVDTAWQLHLWLLKNRTWPLVVQGSRTHSKVEDVFLCHLEPTRSWDMQTSSAISVRLSFELYTFEDFPSSSRRLSFSSIPLGEGTNMTHSVFIGNTEMEGMGAV